MTEQLFKYPEARKADVKDDFHGTLVADPYRWMEESTDPETTDWIEKQNALTREFLDSPEREKIKERLTRLWNYPKYSTPFKRRGRYFFFKNDGLQNQAVMYVKDSPEADAKVVIDPNKLSEDGTAALMAMALSEDAKLLSYGVSRSGSDWMDFHVMEVDSGNVLDDVVEKVRFTSMAWKHDGSGFFYNQFPDVEKDKKGHSKLMFHALGTEKSQDALIYERPREPEIGYLPRVSDDGKYLVMRVWHGTNPKNRVFYSKTDSPKEIVELIDTADASYSFIDNFDDTFIFHTDLDAPRGRVVAVDLDNPERENWKTLIPETEDAIQSIVTAGNKIVVCYMRHATSVVKVFDEDGSPTGEIELPAAGTVAAISGKRDDREMFITFQSFLYPPIILKYDFDSGETSVFAKSEIDFDPEAYETRQVFYTSKDGTKAPLFITHKKGLELDGNNPVLLYGYGGFGISMSPGFSITRLVMMEAGMVYAQAVLRGGGEYGEDWHLAGTLERKQNVFDDFISAGEWLVENKYTNPSKLAIQGGSNGGLLVGACMTQRPDLYGAVLCQVPVLDMLRYHKYTIGKFWVSDYGNAEENAEHFKFMYAYSPLHNVKEGVDYPPTMIMSADTDDRVLPAHAKKFAATLQEKAGKKNPVLLRIETKAGHGAGKPTTKLIDEAADQLRFLFKIMEVEY